MEGKMFRSDLLKGKRILITGGGTGLGKSMGRRFLELGANLTICGRRAEVLEETVKAFENEFGAPVAWHPCDIRDFDAVDSMIETIWRDGPVDVLVNNAAGNFIAQYETLSHRALDAVLDIVLHGTGYVTLACGKRWIPAGHKANVLSIVTPYAWTGSAFVVPSAMGKAGVLAMTRSLAVEWGPKGIRLNAIAPGPFPTKGAFSRLVPRKDLEDELIGKNPLGRAGRHEELANLAAFLAADESAYVNGEVVTIDGGGWLSGAGEFNFLSRLTEEDWEGLRPKKK
jgi:NAD(P)-dependent dehydrogenase (short-subunit alcohol dehydrogenase family)